MRQIPSSWGNLHISGGTPLYLIRVKDTDGNVVGRYSTLPINVTESGSNTPISYTQDKIGSLPTISFKIDLSKGGGVAGAEPIKIKLLENVGDWIEYTVEVYLTFQELGDIELESDALMLFYGVIENIQKTSLYSILEVNSYFIYMLNKKILGETIKADDYPFSPDVGKSKPTVFGHVDCAPGWIKDARIQEDQYQSINPKVSWWDGKVSYTEVRRVMVEVGKKVLARAGGSIAINNAIGEAEWSDATAKDGNLLVYIYLAGLTPKSESPCDPDNQLYFCEAENLFDGDKDTYARIGTGYDGQSSATYPIEDCPELLKFEGAFFAVKIDPTYTCDPNGDPDELVLSLQNNSISVQVWGTGVECGSIDNIWGDSPEQYKISVDSCDLLKNEFLIIDRTTPHIEGNYILNVAGVFLEIKAILKEFIKQKFYADIIGRDIQNSNINPNGPLTESPLGIIWSLLKDDIGISIDNIDEDSFSSIRNIWESNSATRVAGGLIQEQRRGLDLIREITEEFMIGLIFSGDKVKLFLIDPNRNTDFNIGEADIKKDTLVVKSKSIFNLYGQMNFKYDKCYRNGKFRGLVEKVGEGKLNLQKDLNWIRDKITAEEIAESIRNWIGVSRKEVLFKSWLNMIGVEPGDIIQINHPIYIGRVIVTGIKIVPSTSEITLSGMEI